MLCRLSVARGMSERAFVIFRLAIFPFFLVLFLSFFFASSAYSLSHRWLAAVFFIFGLATNNYSCRMCKFIYTYAHTHTRDLTIRSFWKVSNFSVWFFISTHFFLRELNKKKAKPLTHSFNGVSHALKSTNEANPTTNLQREMALVSFSLLTFTHNILSLCHWRGNSFIRFLSPLLSLHYFFGLSYIIVRLACCIHMRSHIRSDLQLISQV